ncbi:MAG TPA: hypothetical protein VE553_09360 [Candidatus Binatia bacterium]|nr:hypothetical protein [Candidatus Binatia bacterium]
MFAVRSNGGLFAAQIDEWHWRRVLPTSMGVNALALMGNWS